MRALAPWGHALWASCGSITHGTVAATYLERRSCELPPIDGDLRWHPEQPYHVRDQREPIWTGPALVGLVTDVTTGEPISLHRTWIKPDGSGKAQLDKPRHLLSRHPSDGMIRLWPDDGVTLGLVIGEGIETCLAAARAGRVPCWACISAGNLAAFPVLPGLEGLTVLVDHDKPNPKTGLRAGHEAALSVLRRYIAAGFDRERDICVIFPPIEGQDAADLAVEAMARLTIKRGGRVMTGPKLDPRDLPSMPAEEFMRLASSERASEQLVRVEPNKNSSRSAAGKQNAPAGDEHAAELADEDEGSTVRIVAPDQQGQSTEDPNWEKKLHAAVREMNTKYFVVSVAGKGLIVSLEKDDHLLRERLVFSRRADISLLYGHRHFKTGKSKRNLDIWKGLGDAWLEHPWRRTYGRMAFIPKGGCPPDVFNLWRGFGVNPKPGDWRLISRHMLQIICSGNQDHFNWLIGWCAYCVQHPGKPAETAVVLRGDKGTGKGSFAQLLMLLFRNHALQISNSRHLVGNFNAHLANTLFLFADEAFWAGDKTGENSLKRMVTEPWLTIEPKGVDAFEVPNMLKILIAANADWVVPATADERRWFVLDVPDSMKGNRAYFDALHRAIKTEAPAFLNHLLKLDLSSFDHRNPPHTDALNSQKIASADSFTKFWLDCLTSGEIVGSDLVGWPATIPTQLLHAAFLDHAHNHGDRHPPPAAIMVKKLASMLPGGKTEPIRPRVTGGDRPPSHKLPHLDQCRVAFLKSMNIDTYEWPEVDQ